jgi:hypothetical protein
LTPKVTDLYSQAQDIKSADQYIYDSTIEDMLAKPVPTIKAWVHKATLRLKTIKDRAKVKRKQEKSKITQIHPFFLQKNKKATMPTNIKESKKKPIHKFVPTTLTQFFAQIWKKAPPPVHNDLYPP